MAAEPAPHTPRAEDGNKTAHGYPEGVQQEKGNESSNPSGKHSKRWARHAPALLVARLPPTEPRGAYVSSTAIRLKIANGLEW